MAEPYWPDRGAQRDSRAGFFVPRRVRSIRASSSRSRPIEGLESRLFSPFDNENHARVFMIQHEHMRQSTHLSGIDGNVSHAHLKGQREKCFTNGILSTQWITFPESPGDLRSPLNHSENVTLRELRENSRTGHEPCATILAPRRRGRPRGARKRKVPRSREPRR